MALCGTSWAASQADLVVVGTVVTMAESRPRAQALAVAGGKVAFVGDAPSARKRLRPGGRLIALEPGQAVFPGLVDAHVHMLDAGVMRQRCTLDEAKTKARALEIIAEYSRAHPELAWVIGSGWALSLFDERGPTAAELDAVVADRPAVFYGQDGHSAWLNSRALAAADIKACKPDPERGRIECTATGEPRGTLREAAVDLVEKVVPQPRTEQWLAGLREAQGYLHSLGITMVQDANVTPRMLEIYHQGASSGQLTMKVVAAQATDPSKPASQADELARLRDRYSAGRLSASTAKIFVDGVLEARTAALLAPYQGGDERGILNWEDPAVLADLVARLDRHGMQIHMHAIGDRAVRSGLDALAAARSANGPSDNRHHIAHLQLVAAADIPRFRALGVIANFQPFWMFPDEWIAQSAEAVIGRVRAQRLFPFRSIVRTGVRMAAGSDWPVSSPNPFPAIQVGTTRQSPDPPVGPPWIPAERVSRRALLAAYTTGGAYVNRREHETGSLEVGKAADLVIVDRNPLTVPVRRLGGTRVLKTFVDGEEVYAAGPAPQEARPTEESAR
jgi:predicted amidohydrolase YtcJ